jgi:hypothetical protein
MAIENIPAPYEVPAEDTEEFHRFSRVCWAFAIKGPLTRKQFQAAFVAAGYRNGGPGPWGMAHGSDYNRLLTYIEGGTRLELNLAFSYFTDPKYKLIDKTRLATLLLSDKFRRVLDAIDAAS